ncbi:Homeodomain-interacting protein kinase 1 [Takifugu flavidus]|uniref:Homeodomain-interacting protein kinase 1 n=1 Tax=Takifugu flavidus TaxID=433684 RepID=A0A5C6N5H2_9TELE|nr:Homeodomain-interacting protein kinase 1 [Takifugu flavidus]
MGSGVYGQVAKCLNKTTKEMVAVKVFCNTGGIHEARWELHFLRKICHFNHPNLVRFIEEFKYKGIPCLVLEILHNDMFRTVKNQEWEVQLNKIRLIAKQLFMAMNALSEAGIVHCDLKPDNIMFVSKEQRKIKLIDFGLSLLSSRVRPGVMLQATSYRAPEILLGLPFDHGIDLWGTGCILAFLYLRCNLFRARFGYETVRQVVQLLGQPEDHLLCQGIYTRKYFLEEEGGDGPTWRLKTPEEYMSGTHEKIRTDIRNCKYQCLDDLVHVSSSMVYEQNLPTAC